MDHLVIRVPVPPGVMESAELMMAAKPHLVALEQLTPGVTHAIEAPAVKRERKKKPAAPAAPPGQTDIEDLTRTEPPVADEQAQADFNAAMTDPPITATGKKKK